MPTDLSPFHGFQEASAAVLQMLQRRAPLQLWMVTRVAGDEQIVLTIDDKGYDIETGDVFRWSDTFCIRMVRGDAPRVAPRSDAIAAYREAAALHPIDINAYVGVPLENDEGGLFGTLCAIDPKPQDDALLELGDEVELCARLLSTVLAQELREVSSERAAAVEEATETPTTFSSALTSEEKRCRVYGGPATLVVLRVAPARAAEASRLLRGPLPPAVMVSDRGEGRLDLLAPETGALAALDLTDRVVAALEKAGIDVAVGVEVRSPGSSSDLTALLEKAAAQVF